VPGNIIQITLKALSPASFLNALICTNNPPRVGDSCTIYGTGFGPTIPPQQDGVPANAVTFPANTCSLKIAGVPAVVNDCGLAAGLVAVNRLDFIYPDGVPGSGLDAQADITVAGQDGAIQVPLPLSVTIAPTSVTVPAGQTQQFTAIVSGVSSTAVIWSATAGTINASGLYTAPSTTPATAMVTATAKADAKISAQAVVTVQRVITVKPATSHSYLYADVPGAVKSFQVTTTGVKIGDSGHIVFLGIDYVNVVSEISPGGQITYEFPIGTPQYSPSWVKFYISGTNGVTSNTIYIPFEGNQNTMALSLTDSFLVSEASYQTFKFKLSDGTTDGAFGLGSFAAIAIDNKTNLVLTSSSFEGSPQGNGVTMYLQTPPRSMWAEKLIHSTKVAPEIISSLTAWPPKMVMGAPLSRQPTRFRVFHFKT
jgi:hypothetical protein